MKRHRLGNRIRHEAGCVPISSNFRIFDVIDSGAAISGQILSILFFRT